MNGPPGYRTFPSQNQAPDSGRSFTALKWDKFVVQEDDGERLVSDESADRAANRAIELYRI
jgi:hypothetical protein